MLSLLDFPFINPDLSLAGLVTLVVLLVLFGALIPRWTHNQRIKDKNAEIALLQKVVDKRDEQHDKLVDKVGLVIQMLEDIKAERYRGGRHRAGPE